MVMEELKSEQERTLRSMVRIIDAVEEIRAAKRLHLDD